MRASDNRFLLVGKSVVLTSTIEPVICALEQYFARAGKTAHVTSGLRVPSSQLSIIRGYLAKTGLDQKYPEAIKCQLTDRVQYEGQSVYAWQPAWSALLNRGIIISPPIAAICLMDYINAQGKNRKGQTITASPHFNGTAFDIGGGADGIDGNVVSELKILQAAQADKLPGLKGFLPERNNNCVHVDCLTITQ